MEYPHLSVKNNDRLVKYSKIEKLLLNSLLNDNKGNMEAVVNSLDFIKHEKEKIIARGLR